MGYNELMGHKIKFACQFLCRLAGNTFNQNFLIEEKIHKPMPARVTLSLPVYFMQFM
jgi:hypothetical protein